MIGEDWVRTGKVVRWIDGDTVVLDIDLGFRLSVRETFRLAGINTPELNSPDSATKTKARAALEFVLTAASPNTPVTIRSAKGLSQEKYGRWLATIFTAGSTESINAGLLNAGLATHY